MNFSQINWKTTGFAIGYLACWLLGQFVPAASSLCDAIEPFIVAGGFVSSADATRIQSIVRAVDSIAWHNQLDPATLTPTTPVAAPVKAA